MGMPTEQSITSVENFIRENDDGTRPVNTQDVYRRALSDFEKFMGFDDEQLFEYARNKKITPSVDLKNYVKACTTAGKNKTTAKLYASVVRGFLGANEWNLKKKKKGKNDDVRIVDEALTIEILQKMMSVGSIHQQVILETMISTGARIGELSCVRLSDLHMKCDPAELRIPGTCTKNGQPVTCYLTSEARRFMEIWLVNRPAYLKKNEDLKNMKYQPGANKDKLFACSKALIISHFRYMLKGAVGAQTNINPAANDRKKAIRYALHPHSCRKYFYSRMLPVLGEVVTNGLLNHSGGYLAAAYGRISEQERRGLWKENEHVLFITDTSGIEAKKNIERQGAVIVGLQRENQMTKSKIDELKEQNEKMQEEMKNLKWLIARDAEKKKS
jgi:integrase